MSGDEENFPNIRQPRTKKGKKILDNRKSKLEEGPRNTLFLRGPKSSDDVRSFMMDIVYKNFKCRSTKSRRIIACFLVVSMM